MMDLLVGNIGEMCIRDRCKSDTDVKSNEVKTSKKTSEYINLTMIREMCIRDSYSIFKVFKAFQK